MVVLRALYQNPRFARPARSSETLFPLYQGLVRSRTALEERATGVPGKRQGPPPLPPLSICLCGEACLTTHCSTSCKMDLATIVGESLTKLTYIILTTCTIYLQEQMKIRRKSRLKRPLLKSSVWPHVGKTVRPANLAYGLLIYTSKKRKSSVLIILMHHFPHLHLVRLLCRQSRDSSAPPS